MIRHVKIKSRKICFTESTQGERRAVEEQGEGEGRAGRQKEKKTGKGEGKHMAAASLYRNYRL
jgi:hypothetical protein